MSLSATDTTRTNATGVGSLDDAEPAPVSIQYIPLSRLKQSPANARKTGVTIGLDELAASIATHGLLQPLIVHPEPNGEGAEAKWYLVSAGERRRKALGILAKRKKIKKSALVACVVRSDGIPAEISLVENMIRASMHPADQFEAFQKLHFEHGLGVEEIGARFSVSSTIVRQRLKLAAVCPKLMALYREGELTLDQLMAFTLTDDPARQEEIWARLSWNKGPEMIRKLLTESHVSCRDRRVAFVGLEAYEAAGGAVLRDLFVEDHDGWLTDVALLDRLVAEKLEAAAMDVRQEGWKWVEVHAEYPHGQVAAFRRIYPETVPLSDEAQARLDGLTGRYDELAAEHGEDNVPADVEAELEALDTEIDSLNLQTRAYATEDMAIAGVIVSISSEGALRVERGFLKREDEPRRTEGKPTATEANEPKIPMEAGEMRPLPDALIADLTAHRTMALQECLAARPDVALLAITHTLVLAMFHRGAFDDVTCLDVKAEAPNLATAAPGIADTPAGHAMSARQEKWVSMLPGDGELWSWLITQDEETRLSLLAYCVARTVNAIQRPNSGKRALTHVAQLARAVGLDMAEWWTPTRDNYLGRVSKARILEAVREGLSDKDAADIEGLKKDAMVDHAERLLFGTRWLPEVLRTAPAAAAPKAASM